MPDLVGLLGLGLGSLAFRWLGRTIQVVFSLVIWVWPQAARPIVSAVCWRYPRARDALMSQLEEDLATGSWLERRANVLDGLAGLLSQARDTNLAERSPRTATEPPVEQHKTRDQAVAWPRRSLFLSSSFTQPRDYQRLVRRIAEEVNESETSRLTNQLSLDWLGRAEQARNSTLRHELEAARIAAVREAVTQSLWASLDEWRSAGFLADLPSDGRSEDAEQDCLDGD